ncbi:conserved Plasmodium protein, unknown function [Plasmodium sp. DRC-Itaito]|nr:conserved Plasmodium protein, unknown function [Plasmodium sp. DRC-Itaito]
MNRNNYAFNMGSKKNKKIMLLKVCLSNIISINKLLYFITRPEFLFIDNLYSIFKDYIKNRNEYNKERLNKSDYYYEQREKLYKEHRRKMNRQNIRTDNNNNNNNNNDNDNNNNNNNNNNNSNSNIYNNNNNNNYYYSSSVNKVSFDDDEKIEVESFLDNNGIVGGNKKIKREKIREYFKKEKNLLKKLNFMSKFNKNTIKKSMIVMNNSDECIEKKKLSFSLTLLTEFDDVILIKIIDDLLNYYEKYKSKINLNEFMYFLFNIYLNICTLTKRIINHFIDFIFSFIKKITQTSQNIMSSLWFLYILFIIENNHIYVFNDKLQKKIIVEQISILIQISLYSYYSKNVKNNYNIQTPLPNFVQPFNIYYIIQNYFINNNYFHIKKYNKNIRYFYIKNIKLIEKNFNIHDYSEIAAINALSFLLMCFYHTVNYNGSNKSYICESSVNIFYEHFSKYISLIYNNSLQNIFYRYVFLLIMNLLIDYNANSKYYIKKITFDLYSYITNVDIRCIKALSTLFKKLNETNIDELLLVPTSSIFSLKFNIINSRINYINKLSLIILAGNRNFYLCHLPKIAENISEYIKFCNDLKLYREILILICIIIIKNDENEIYIIIPTFISLILQIYHVERIKYKMAVENIQNIDKEDDNYIYDFNSYNNKDVLSLLKTLLIIINILIKRNVSFINFYSWIFFKDISIKKNRLEENNKQQDNLMIYYPGQKTLEYNNKKKTKKHNVARYVSSSSDKDESSAYNISVDEENSLKTQGRFFDDTYYKRKDNSAYANKMKNFNTMSYEDKSLSMTGNINSSKDVGCMVNNAIRQNVEQNNILNHNQMNNNNNNMYNFNERSNDFTSNMNQQNVMNNNKKKKALTTDDYFVNYDENQNITEQTKLNHDNQDSVDDVITVYLNSNQEDYLYESKNNFTSVRSDNISSMVDIKKGIILNNTNMITNDNNLNNNINNNNINNNIHSNSVGTSIKLDESKFVPFLDIIERIYSSNNLINKKYISSEEIKNEKSNRTYNSSLQEGSEYDEGEEEEYDVDVDDDVDIVDVDVEDVIVDYNYYDNENNSVKIIDDDERKRSVHFYPQQIDGNTLKRNLYYNDNYLREYILSTKNELSGYSSFENNLSSSSVNSIKSNFSNTFSKDNINKNIITDDTSDDNDMMNSNNSMNNMMVPYNMHMTDDEFQENIRIIISSTLLRYDNIQV